MTRISSVTLIVLAALGVASPNVVVAGDASSATTIEEYRAPRVTDSTAKYECDEHSLEVSLIARKGGQASLRKLVIDGGAAEAAVLAALNSAMARLETAFIVSVGCTKSGTWRVIVSGTVRPAARLAGEDDDLIYSHEFTAQKYLRGEKVDM